jgi:transmembrane sensor
MNDRLEHARRVSERIDAGWGRADVEAQLSRLHARQRRRARRRVIGAPLAVVAIALAALVAWPRPSLPVAREVASVAPPRPPAVVVPAPVVTRSPPSGVIALGDGSVVTPLGEDSRLLARQVSETDVVVTLAGGGAQFDVPERAERRFRAELGSFALETHGAAFRVGMTRRQIEVAAERGEVSVRWGHERRVVAAGQTRTFAAHEDIRVDRDEPVPSPAPDWRDDAVRGDYAAAWAKLERAAPLERMEDLLLAGDVARLSSHAGAALGPLARAVALHPNDPRAPLAEFTLGRVHLEDLGAPRDAANAFARARALAPTGPLAEDALAREVEAWSRAGELELARARAQTYLQRYPQGHRTRAVRRFGGLEAP